MMIQNNLIHEGERLDELQRNGYGIIQNPARFCFGMDAVLLSGFAKAKAGEKVLDLGTGTGIIPILMEAKTDAADFTALEIQEESADMSEAMVELFKNGDLDMLIGRSLYQEGYKCAENFDKLFKGEKVPKFEFLEAEYLTEETADELLPKYKELFERTKDDEFFERYEAREFIAE